MAPLCFFLVFCSGACALVYQAVWFQSLRLLFGASTPSTSVTLGVFMLGMGTGALVFSALLKGLRRVFSCYLVVEICIGFFAFLSLPAIKFFQSFILNKHAYWFHSSPFLFAFKGFVSVVVLLPATFLMGGTLPLVVAVLGGRSVGLIYGFNTLGALLGVVLSAFWSIERLGLQMTLSSFALINIAVFSLVLVFFRFVKPQFLNSLEQSISLHSVQKIESHSSCELQSSSQKISPFILFLLAFLCGFLFFVMELIWYRSLAPLLGGSTYTLSLVLCFILGGIASGSFYFRWLQRRGYKVTKLSLSATWLLSATVILLPYLFQEYVTFLALLLRPLRVYGFLGLVTGWAGVAAAVTFVPACVSGFQFPQLLHCFSDQNPARRIGQLVGFNTFGAVCGALLGGFLFIPYGGVAHTWLFVASATAAVGLLLMIFSWRQLPFISKGSGFVCGGVFIFGGLLLLPLAPFSLPQLDVSWSGPDAVWRHTGIGAGRGTLALSQHTSIAEYKSWRQRVRAGLLWEEDGRESAVGVLKNSGSALVVNGKVDGHATGDAGTQIMGGLLPALLHPHPERALVIGFGTGSTAGWLAQVASIEKVTVYEIEPAVIKAARFFDAVNQHPLRQPKVTVREGDGRWLLYKEEKPFDIIFSEPSNPYRAGVGSFYTKEFYLSAKEKLSENGIFAQWTQAYEIDSPTLLSIARTLAEVFPAVEIWSTQQGDLVFLCSRRPLVFDAHALSQKQVQTPFYQGLRDSWRATSLEHLFARRVAGPAFAAKLRDVSLPLMVNTDDHNVVEFGFARTVGKKFFVDTAELFWAWHRLVGGTSAEMLPVPSLNQKALAEARAEVYGPQWAQALGAASGAGEELSVEGFLSDIKAHSKDFSNDFLFVKSIQSLSSISSVPTFVTLAKDVVTQLRVTPWIPPKVVTWGLQELLAAAKSHPEAAKPVADLLLEAPFAAWMHDETRIDTAVNLLYGASDPYLDCEESVQKMTSYGEFFPQHASFVYECLRRRASQKISSSPGESKITGTPLDATTLLQRTFEHLRSDDAASVTSQSLTTLLGF